MTDTDNYILERIHIWVWSGFYSPAEVDERIDDILGEDADEAMLRAAVGPEFAKKTAAEASWPKTTDCDRLDQAFLELNRTGIIALHNAGMTMSDGVSDVAEVLHQNGSNFIQGYCFYHGQDVERAVNGQGLTIAFCDINEDKNKKAEIGYAIKSTLERHGLNVEWNGDSNVRLVLPTIDWKRRSAGP
jgi:hypothetical protein